MSDMLGQIMSMFTEAVTFVYDTFTEFVTGSFFGLFITCFVMVSVVRLLIIPIVGGSLNVGSDRVKSKNTSKDGGMRPHAKPNDGNDY